MSWVRLAALLLALLSAPVATAGEPQLLLIAPSGTDARLGSADAPHLVSYRPEAPAGALVVWLAGTGGKPTSGPAHFYASVLQQGHRLLGLSYLTTPAVGQVCVGLRLRALPDCAARFRQQRVWGDSPTDLIGDRPADAIVPRLTSLLQHLGKVDPTGAWAQYLDGAEPRWDRIYLAGQSQGGGMAAYLAKSRAVAGVLMFSGGWDRGPGNGDAAWYRRASLTPPQRWHATYHVDEAMAGRMAHIYAELLQLPATQIHALDSPMLGTNPHAEGISNPAYAPIWRLALPPLP